MKIHVGCDHAGFKLKTALCAHLRKHGHEVVDHGTHSEESVDYPDFAGRVARAVRDEKGTMGLIVCSSGVGISIVANKVRGIRAANVFTETMARLARAHNDANVLCLGQAVNPEEEASAMLDAFLATPHEGGRHARRVDKITDIETQEGR